MKALRLVTLIAPLVAVLSSCGPSHAVQGRVTDRTVANRTYAAEAKGYPLPGKHYPVAEVLAGNPDFIVSPYTQQPIHRGRLKVKRGPLVEDPTVHFAVRYFLLPRGY